MLFLELKNTQLIIRGFSGKNLTPTGIIEDVNIVSANLVRF